MKKRILAVLSALCLLSGCSNSQNFSELESQISLTSSTAEISISEPTNEPTNELETQNTVQSAELNYDDYETFESGTIKWLVTSSDNGTKILSTPLIWNDDPAQTTEELVLSYAYIALKELIETYETDDVLAFVVFFDLSGGTSEVIATTSLLNVGSLSSSALTWQGKYEHLNDLEYNKELSDRINLKIKNPIESGGYKITFPGTYSFRKVDNMYSEDNGKTVVAIDVEIENISATNEYCLLHETISTPNNSENVYDKSTYFNDLNISRKCSRGTSFKGAFCILYDGTGKYLISIGSLSPDGSYEINVDETPEERGIEPNPAVEDTELSAEQEDPVQYDKEHILSLGCGSYKTENGSTWYLEDSSANAYVAYPEDIGYDIDDNVAIYLFSDMVDIIANGLQVKSEMYPMASFTVCKTDGTLIATALFIVMGENNTAGFPLTFYGDYDYLNDTEATKMVQDVWNGNSEQRDGNPQ